MLMVMVMSQSKAQSVARISSLQCFCDSFIDFGITSSRIFPFSSRVRLLSKPELNDICVAPEIALK